LLGLGKFKGLGTLEAFVTYITENRKLQIKISIGKWCEPSRVKFNELCNSNTKLAMFS